MSDIIHNTEAQARILSEEQLRRTSFLFDVFDGVWAWRTDIRLALLKPAVIPDPKDTTIDRYRPFFIVSAPMLKLRSIDGACDAEDVTIPSVGAGTEPILVVAMLIYSKNTPIAHLGHATGLPLWTNGGDIKVTWDNGRNRLFRTHRPRESHE